MGYKAFYFGGTEVLPSKTRNEAAPQRYRINNVVDQDSRDLDSITSSSAAASLSISSVIANGSEGNNLPANVTDGSFDTYWSNKEIGSWLLLDLGTRQKIRSVKIAWHLGDLFGYQYEISISDDATDFTYVDRGRSDGYSSSFQEYMLARESSAIRYTIGQA